LFSLNIACENLPHEENDFAIQMHIHPYLSSPLSWKRQQLSRNLIAVLYFIHLTERESGRSDEETERQGELKGNGVRQTEGKELNFTLELWRARLPRGKSMSDSSKKKVEKDADSDRVYA